MPQYMLLIGGVTQDHRPKNPAEGERLFKQYSEWSEKLARLGAIKDANKLKDQSGHRLTFKAGKVVDGPFTETKETIGGYYVLEAKSYAHACELAGECPSLLHQGGWVEVREVEEIGGEM